MRKAQKSGDDISIHSPRVRGDGFMAFVAAMTIISIHSPRVRGDGLQTAIDFTDRKFLSTPLG